MKSQLQTVFCVSIATYLALPAVAQAQYNYVTNGDNTITITGYTGVGGSETVPDLIDGRRVTTIGDSAFLSCFTLSGITLGTNVTSIGDSAFKNCTALTSATLGPNVTNILGSAFFSCSSLSSIYFQGNAPALGDDAFYNVPATFYYRPGYSGWHTTTFSGH